MPDAGGNQRRAFLVVLHDIGVADLPSGIGADLVQNPLDGGFEGFGAVRRQENILEQTDGSGPVRHAFFELAVGFDQRGLCLTLLRDLAAIDVQIVLALDRPEGEQEISTVPFDLHLAVLAVLGGRFRAIRKFIAEILRLVGPQQVLDGARRLIGQKNLAVRLHPHDRVGVFGRELGGVGQIFLIGADLGYIPPIAIDIAHLEHRIEQEVVDLFA